MTIATVTRTGASGRRRTRAPLVGLTAAVLLAGGSAALPRVPLLLYNRTPSMPIGLYVRNDGVPGRGDVIAFRLPRSAWGYAQARGEPTDIVLLKHVLAAGGDHVSTLSGRLTINGADIGPIPAIDSAGRGLPQWRADRVLAADELLAGSTLPRSFDGRFFGPIRLADVLGVYQRLDIGSASPAPDDGATVPSAVTLAPSPELRSYSPCPCNPTAQGASSDCGLPVRRGAELLSARGDEGSAGEERVQCRAR